MALKILKKEPKPEQRLPEGADRFVWTEIPGAVKPHPKYAEVLKGPKKPT